MSGNGAPHRNRFDHGRTRGGHENDAVANGPSVAGSRTHPLANTTLRLKLYPAELGPHQVAQFVVVASSGGILR